MKVTAYKTKKIKPGDKLFKILDESLPGLRENDVVVITSKIISICQGRVVKNNGKITKFDLTIKEADYYLPEEYVNYGIYMTIKNNFVVASAGIDESNGGGYFILWPENLQQTTNEIWEHLRKKNKIKNLGIVVSDSKIIPMRKGTSGVGLSWCGFEPLRNYIGAPDIFGHNLRVTKASLVDGISASAVLNMGEGKEQTPLAVVSEIANINFVQRTPTMEELDEMSIKPSEDVYGKILSSVKWLKGGS
ncbi:MAG: coenzyme F420-0:L-glutamate ligase [Patescibacteria group bacterium]|nr:coenzyme F420-0:L-glutamate ligase [Patescibacteria group bacterium]